MSIDKAQFKQDMAAFKRHKKSVNHMAKANRDCETFADSMLDFLACSLDRLYGGRKFMDEACK